MDADAIYELMARYACILKAEYSYAGDFAREEESKGLSRKKLKIKYYLNASISVGNLCAVLVVPFQSVYCKYGESN